ncbi:MAG: lysylphosphatidylglycerol synthase transmembrane domain-containing protein [Gemmatimonadota bacterium]
MNRYVRIGAFLLGAVVLTLLIRHSGPALVWQTLRESAWVLGPVIILWGLVYACNARAWQLLMPNRPPEFTFWRAFLLTIAGFAMNYSIPALSVGGEPLKIAGAAQWVGRRRAVGSAVGFRFLQSIAHILILLVAMIPAAILLPHTPLVYGALGLTSLLIALAAWFLLSQHRDGIFERGVAFLSRLGPLRRLATKLESNRPLLQELDVELTAIHNAPGQFKWALGMELTGRVLSTMEYALIFYGLGLGADVMRAFVVANLATLFTNLLFFMPFEMGSKEGGAFVVFAWLGMDPKLGTSAALLSRVRELAWMALGLGAILLLDDGKKAKTKPG